MKNRHLIFCLLQLLIVPTLFTSGRFAAHAAQPAHDPLQKRNAPNRPILQVQAGTGGILSFALSANGRIAATGSFQGWTSVWEVETGRVLRYLHQDVADLVYDVALSADGKLLLTRVHDHVETKNPTTHITLWNVSSGQEIKQIGPKASNISRVTLSPNGKYLLVGDRNGAMTLWDVASNQVVRTFIGHNAAIAAVAFSPDSRFLLSGSQDATARIWDVTTGREIWRLKGHRSLVYDVTWALNGARVATGSTDKSACVWDIRTGKEIRRMENNLDGVSGVALSPDGNLLYTGNPNPSFTDRAHNALHHRQIWNVATGQELPPPRQMVPEFPFDAATGSQFAAFTPDGTKLLVGSGAFAILVWDVTSSKQTGLLRSTAANVLRFYFRPDGKTLVEACEDVRGIFWDAGSGNPPDSGTNDLVRLLAEGATYSITPDRRFGAVGGGKPTYINDIRKALINANIHLQAPYAANSVLLIDAETGAEIRRLPGFTENVTALAFSADDKLLAGGSEDQTCRIWDTATGREVQHFKGTFFGALALSPDGRYLASTPGLSPGVEQASRAGHIHLDNPRDIAIQLWDIQTGKEVRKLVGHTLPAQALAFSPDGNSLLSGGWDETAILWDVSSGKERMRLNGHRNTINCVAFSPNGAFLLTGGNDGTGRIWDAVTGREKCTLIHFLKDDWAVIDPAGRYDAANSGDVEGLHWVVNNKTVELKQLQADYYEPGLLAKILGNNKEPLRKVKPLAEFDLNLPPVANIVQKNGSAVVTLLDEGGGIGPTEVFVNGQRVYIEPSPKQSGKSFTFTMNLARPEFHGKLLPDGTNSLAVVGHTNDRAVRPDRPDYLASRATIVSLPAPAAPVTPPRVFILAVGASQFAGPRLTLRFAAKDAIDFSREVTAAAVGWLGKERVFSTLLASDAEHPELRPATRANIMAALDAIRKEARAADIVLLYLAGHGVAAGSGDRDYYYVTADADDATPGTALFSSVTLSGTQLSDRLTQINANKKVIILDTCASGQFDKREIPGDIKRSWENMKDHTGSYVLAGCAADAVSYESSRYNQGLLTYCLLEAMKANDGVWVEDAKSGGPYLDVQKWLTAAEASVPGLVEEARIEGVQRPEFKAGKDARDFIVGRMTPDERKAIRLATPLPVLLPTQTVRDESSTADEDTLGLRTKLNDLMLAKSSRGRGQGYALWKTEEQPGAYRFNMRYKAGSEITAIVNLFHFPKVPKAKAEPIAAITITAPLDKLPEALLNAVIRQIEIAESTSGQRKE